MQVKLAHLRLLLHAAEAPAGAVREADRNITKWPDWKRDMIMTFFYNKGARSSSATWRHFTLFHPDRRLFQALVPSTISSWRDQDNDKKAGTVVGSRARRVARVRV